MSRQSPTHKINPENKIHKKIHELINYLNDDEEQNQEGKRSRHNHNANGLNLQLQPEFRLSKAEQQYKHHKNNGLQQAQQLESMLYQLEKQRIECSFKHHWKKSIIEEHCEILSDQIKQFEQAIKNTDSRLANKYKQYRDRILNIKLKLKEEEQTFKQKKNKTKDIVDLGISKINNEKSKNINQKSMESQYSGKNGFKTKIMEDAQKKQYYAVTVNTDNSLNFLHQKLALLKSQIQSEQKLIESQQQSKYRSLTSSFLSQTKSSSSSEYSQHQCFIKIVKKYQEKIDEQTKILQEGFDRNYETLEKIVTSVTEKIK